MSSCGLLNCEYVLQGDVVKLYGLYVVLGPRVKVIIWNILPASTLNGKYSVTETLKNKMLLKDCNKRALIVIMINYCMSAC